MRIEFAKDALNHTESFSWLDRILYLVEDGRHDWRIPEPTTVLNSQWFKTLGRNKIGFNDLFQKSIGLSLNNNRFQVVTVTCSPKSAFQFQAKQAYHYLNKPLLIIVENAESDGAFIELILAKFAKRDLYRLKNEAFLEIDGPGGKGEIPKTLKRKVSGSMPRIVTVADGDGLLPGQIDKKAKKIIKLCEKLGIPCHITIKRELENYIPIRFLTEWTETRGRDVATAYAYRRLNADQRSFFDMKKGFPKNKQKELEIPEAQSELFQNVSSTDLQALRPGFGNDVWTVFQKYFKRISKRNLKETAGDELDTLLQLIYSRA